MWHKSARKLTAFNTLTKIRFFQNYDFLTQKILRPYFELILRHMCIFICTLFMTHLKSPCVAQKLHTAEL